MKKSELNLQNFKSKIRKCIYKVLVADSLSMSASSPLWNTTGKNIKYIQCILKIILNNFLIITKVTPDICRESRKSEVHRRKLQSFLILSSKDKVYM